MFSDNFGKVYKLVEVQGGIYLMHFKLFVFILTSFL